MSMSLRAATRASLVGGVALLTAALTVSSATAASAELSYSCDFGVDEVEATGDASAMFDSGIGEGLVVQVDDRVNIDPFTGEITLPDAFTEALRDAGVAEVDGQRLASGDSPGLLLTFLDEAGEEYVVELLFGTTAVPAEGPLVLEVTGEPNAVMAAVVGTNTLVADDFFLDVGTGDDGPLAGMYCSLTDDGDVSIDSFEATAAPTPTATPTSSTSPTSTAVRTPTAAVTPVRPVVVQTDFAGDDRTTSLPLLAGGSLAAAAVAVAVGHGTRRGGTRRH